MCVYPVELKGWYTHLYVPRGLKWMIYPPVSQCMYPVDLKGWYTYLYVPRGLKGLIYPSVCTPWT